VPTKGGGADLLVITPRLVGADVATSAEVATTPAIPPDTDPPFRTLDMGAGVAVIRLEPSESIGLNAETVVVRANGPDGTVEGDLVVLSDHDPQGSTL
jgi:hypothetical protein